MFAYFALLLSFPAVYVVLEVFAKNNKKKQLLSALIPSALLFIILGFKGLNVGADTPSYVNLYYGLRDFSWGYYHHFIEIGYFFVTKAFSLLGFDYRFYQLFLYLIICFCLFFSSYKLSRNPVFSLYIFSSFIFMNFFISGLRQGFAISLCVLAFTIVFSGGRTPWRSVLYFALVAIATSFHESSIIFVIPYFLLNVKLNIKGLLILLFFSAFFSIFGSQIYEWIYHYTDNNYPPFTAGVGKISILFVIIVVFCFFLHRPSIFKTKTKEFIDSRIFIKHRELDVSKEISVFGKYDALSVLAVLVFIGAWLENTSRYNSGFGRISMFFSIFLIFLIPNSLEQVTNSKTKNAMLIILSVCFFAFFLYYSIVPNYLWIRPYDFFF